MKVDIRGKFHPETAKTANKLLQGEGMEQTLPHSPWKEPNIPALPVLDF
jgi:hypothetical protein